MICWSLYVFNSWTQFISINKSFAQKCWRLIWRVNSPLLNDIQVTKHFRSYHSIHFYRSCFPREFENLERNCLTFLHRVTTFSVPESWMLLLQVATKCLKFCSFDLRHFSLTRRNRAETDQKWNMFVGRRPFLHDDGSTLLQRVVWEKLTKRNIVQVIFHQNFYRK